MFDAILKEYEKSKKTVEKENGKLLSSDDFWENKKAICLHVYLFWSNVKKKEILRKEIKILSEPITKKILLGVNSVRTLTFFVVACSLLTEFWVAVFFFSKILYFFFRMCKCYIAIRKSSKKKSKSSNRKSVNSTRIWIHG